MSTLSILRLSAFGPEGTGSPKAFTFRVTRGGDITAEASAKWSVAGGGVAGTLAATASDFAGNALPTGWLSFAPGQAVVGITIEVMGDSLVEFNESFTVTLSEPSAGVVLGTASATAAILNDDAPAVIEPRMFFIDPTAAAGGDGSFERPFNAWGQVPLAAGDMALQRGGTVSTGFAVTAQGTAARPIVIGSYGVGQARIEGTVALSGAEHVVLSNLDITGGKGHGVVLTGGTSSSVVRDCTIHGGVAGVVLTPGIAHSNVIIGNSIFENDHAGIWFDGAIAARQAETLVTGNTIYRNGQQGILLHGSHVIIDRNTVVNNGLSGLPGVSGIHVFGESESDVACHENVISNNVVAYQRDGSSSDGNGIMIDHWSTNQSLIGNRVFGNDGCGISIFSAGYNLIRDNILEGNMVDSGGTHVIAHAELYLGEAGFALGRTVGNEISNNTIIATSRYGAAVQLEATVAGQSLNKFAANGLRQEAVGALWIAGKQRGGLLADWNALAMVDADVATAEPVAAPMAFDAPLLARGFTLHSDILRSPATTHITVLVANGAARDIVGGPHGSWIAGDGRDNVLSAFGGDNLISSGGGNATLRGGPGADSLFGGIGSTRIFAGSGNSLLVGGAGDSLLVGGAGDDLIFAGNGVGADRIDGGLGENTIIAGDGVDTFVLGRGISFIYQFGRGQDRLDVTALNLSGIGDLVIAGDARATAISDRRGVVYALLDGIAVSDLSSADFIFDRRDGTATLSVEALDATRPEGNDGSTAFTFRLTRTGDLSVGHSAAWSVAGVQGATTLAADAQDFAGGVLPSGIARFAPGEAGQIITVQVAGDAVVERDASFAVDQTSQTITVKPKGDTTVEHGESFTLTLAAPSAGLSLGIASAIGIIQNDDAQVSIARLAAVRSEGQSGTTPFLFEVKRTGNTVGAATVHWSVVGGSQAGTLAAGAADFAGGVLPGGTLLFAAGQTSRVVTVQVAGDTVVELNESFSVVLSSVQAGISLGQASAVGVIYNDDTPGTGTLSVERLDAARREGDQGATAFTFIVRRTGDSSGTASADWTVSGGGVASTVAASGADFTAGVLPSGRVSFAAGETERRLTIGVAGDGGAELNDSFTVSLSGVQAGVAVATGSASGIIFNDDVITSTGDNEVLRGFASPDIFILGGGRDEVIGRGGVDTFRFLPSVLGSARDFAVTFEDFSPGEGEKLDLRAIDAIARTRTDDAFSFIGEAAFSDVAGQLRWEDTGALRMIQGDINGDKWADLTIYVATPGAVQADWFLL